MKKKEEKKKRKKTKKKKKRKKKKTKKEKKKKETKTKKKILFDECMFAEALALRISEAVHYMHRSLGALHRHLACTSGRSPRPRSELVETC